MLQRKIFLLMSPYQTEGFVTQLSYLIHFILSYISVSSTHLYLNHNSCTNPYSQRGISRWEMFLMTSTHVPEEEKLKLQQRITRKITQLSSWCQIPAHQSQPGGSARGEQNTSCYTTLQHYCTKVQYLEITFHQLPFNWLQVTQTGRTCTAHGNSL